MLVTGGCGFVGSRLCSRLAATGHEVVIVDRRSPPIMMPMLGRRVHLVGADVRDRRSFAQSLAEYQPETIFYLAAIHYIPRCSAHSRECIGVNVDGTQAVLDACAANSCVRTVVLALSAAVYAPAAIPHTEEADTGPTDIYGHTKLWAEQLMHLFHARTGIGVGIARLFNVFGPGETNPHLIPTIIEQMRQGRTLRLGDLTTAQDYLYVDDAVDGLVRLADACPNRTAMICNFGSERAVDGWSLVRMIQALSGEAFVVEHDPSRVRFSDRPVLVGDCTRAHRILGWWAETPLEEGIIETLRRPWANSERAG
jgi:UDP-glucose 4-epimerase